MERAGDLVHPPLHVPKAELELDVGEHVHEGRRRERRGAHVLDEEVAGGAQAGIGEEAADGAVHRPEKVEAKDPPERAAPDHLEGALGAGREVGGVDRVVLGLRVAEEAAEGFLDPLPELRELPAHLSGVGVEVEDGPVLEKVPPVGDHRDEDEVVLEAARRGGEDRPEDRREGEDGGAEVEGEPLRPEEVELPPGPGVFLADRDLESGAGQGDRGGKPAQAGPDHGHPVRAVSLHRAPAGRATRPKRLEIRSALIRPDS